MAQNHYTIFADDAMYFLLTIFLWTSLITVPVSCRTSIQEREAEYFTNTWSVRSTGGPEKVKKLAKNLGFDLVEQVTEGLPDIYLFLDPKYPEKTNHSADHITVKLKEVPEITWVEQQAAENRVTRSFFSSLLPEGFSVSIPSLADGFSFREPAADKVGSISHPQRGKSSLKWDGPVEAYACLDSKNPKAKPIYRSLNLNDEYWLRQYYIQDCRDNFDKPPSDLNLVPVWIKYHLFGNNIKVVVVDDGVEIDHLDLVDNYDPSLGLDLQDDDRSPKPEHVGGRKYSHGTRCAGVIGMKANNTVCGVGIAPSVTLGAVRLLGPKPSTDYKDGRALLFKHTEVHIMSNSWGPNDDGKTMSYFGPQTRSALKTGVTKGRGGKGLIYIFACGNGKKDGDNCGCDPFVSTIYTIAVASCDHRGKITNYSERCASVMVTTYSGDRSTPYNVVTTDIGRLKTECTTEHTGTSASAPMVAGAVALALEANSVLTWRDIQHLLAWTCQVAPLQNNRNTWIKNGAGFYVSHDFGFGLLNIKDLVENARGFKRVAAMNTCISRAPLKNGMPFQGAMKLDLQIDGCEGSPSEVLYLEHVQVTVSLAFPRRGNLQITLTSPAGTTARLLDPRPFDTYPFGIPVWTFDSIMTWGESPRGTWTVNIIDKAAHKNRHARSTVRSIPKPTKPSFSSGFFATRSPLNNLYNMFDSINQKAGCPVQRIGNGVKKFWSTLQNIRDEIVSDTYSLDSDGSSSGYAGELKELNLIFHGTSGKQRPAHYKAGPRPYYEFTLPT